MKRTKSAKLVIGSAIAALALGVAACEIEEAPMNGDLDDPVLEGLD